MEAALSLLVVLFTLLMTAVITLVSLAASLVFTVLPFVMIFGVIWWVNKNQLTLSVPVRAVNRVKVTTCSACGAHRSTPSTSAYVHCDQCGQLCDWDFKAAMSDRRSRAPGPAYEQLLARMGPRIEAAKKGGDRADYEAVQKELWEAYAKACPAACPPRVGDPRYREQWVAWSARAQAAQDLDPACVATLSAQAAATGALQWDRSNPFQPLVEVTSYRALLEAVIAHQAQVMTQVEPLLDEHPDHPEADVFRKIGVAAFVQGWLPFLPKSEHAATLERTNLSDEYIEPPVVELKEGPCPCCGKPLVVPASAKRVVCTSCGHSAAVGAGELPCMGCGATLVIPPSGAAVCGYCDLRLERLA